MQPSKSKQPDDAYRPLTYFELERRSRSTPENRGGDITNQVPRLPEGTSSPWAHDCDGLPRSRTDEQAGLAGKN